MKRNIIAIMVLIFTFSALIGCKGTKINIDPKVEEFGINTLGFSIGMAVAQQPEWIDIAFRNIYNQVVNNKFDPDTLDYLVMSLFNSDNPALRILANRVLRMVELMGGLVTEVRVIYIGEFNPNFMTEMAKGYVEGYDLMKDIKK